MRALLLAAVLCGTVATPREASACGYAARTPPYQNLVPLLVVGAGAGILLFAADLTPAGSAPVLPAAQLAIAGTEAVSAVSMALTHDAVSDGGIGPLLVVGTVSALLAVHVAASLLEERDTEADLVGDILRDRTITEGQKQALVEIYRSFQREQTEEDGTPHADSG